jgi:hypothetical protein
MRIARLIGILATISASAATSAAAAGGGPGASLDFGSLGVSHGSLRYVTVLSGRRTVVEAVQRRGGRIVRATSIPGLWGIPIVGSDGSTDGLSRDGRKLVLQSATPRPSKFAVLDTRTLRVWQTVTLPRSFSFDALSPDARTLYLIQHVVTRNSNSNRYYVRAYDLAASRLLKKIVFDRREKWGLMSGSPVTRVSSKTGKWVYTLYARPGGSPFVHMLNAIAQKAVCVDLPWHGSQAPIYGMKLKLHGRSLLVHPQGNRTTFFRVDTRSFRVIRA